MRHHCRTSAMLFILLSNYHKYYGILIYQYKQKTTIEFLEKNMGIHLQWIMGTFLFCLLKGFWDVNFDNINICFVRCAVKIFVYLDDWPVMMLFLFVSMRLQWNYSWRLDKEIALTNNGIKKSQSECENAKCRQHNVN